MGTLHNGSYTAQWVCGSNQGKIPFFFLIISTKEMQRNIDDCFLCCNQKEFNFPIFEVEKVGTSRMKNEFVVFSTIKLPCACSAVNKGKVTDHSAVVLLKTLVCCVCE